MADTHDITVLIPVKLHPHAVDRIHGAFKVLVTETPDASLLSEEERAQVRALAVSTVANAPIDATYIDAFPNLEIISSFGVGYNHVDAGYAGKKGVVVTNTPDVLTEEVADTAIGLLLNTVRELPKAEAWLREGKWRAVGDYPLTRGTLRGRKVGIFGLGRIGKAIARRLEAFGLPISYHNRRPVEGVSYTYYPTLVELAGAVDTLICIAPGGASTDKAINSEVLAALGSDGIFINIGRGTSVDEDALAQALENGVIMAAGLDVFANEPHVPEALLKLENTSLLPHVGSGTIHTRQAMADLVVDNLLSWFTEGRAISPTPETEHLNPKG